MKQNIYNQKSYEITKEKVESVIKQLNQALERYKSWFKNDCNQTFDTKYPSYFLRLLKTVASDFIQNIEVDERELNWFLDIVMFDEKQSLKK